MNQWATPCDGDLECSSNADEGSCKISQWYQLFTMLLGYLLISLCLFGYVTYTLKRYHQNLMKLNAKSEYSTTTLLESVNIWIAVALKLKKGKPEAISIFNTAQEKWNNPSETICYLKVPLSTHFDFVH